MIRARALVKLLRAGFKDVDVTVFGRFADFTSAVKRMRPDAALSLPVALASLGLQPSIQGAGPTGKMEPYVLLTPHVDLTVSQLPERTIGVVDVVGRSALPTLVKELVGLTKSPKIRRVLKVADLLPLLSLELADAIVLPERMMRPLLASSRLGLRILRPSGALLSRTALAYTGKSAEPVIESGLSRLPPEALRALGVLQWEPVS